jgi:hypothetical protein
MGTELPYTIGENALDNAVMERRREKCAAKSRIAELLHIRSETALKDEDPKLYKSEAMCRSV